jgi:phospholipid/cholesterol/gamma-HCH transport system substrate-binding protein
MNQVQQTARVGLFFLLGVALIWVAYQTLRSGKVADRHGYTLHAAFQDLKDLKVSDEVRVAGVRVGSVDGTALVNRHAEAQLRIQRGVQIPSDSVATIAMAGLLGSEYVSIEVGSAGAPVLQDGGTIQTRDTPDINSVMKDLGDLGQKLQESLGSFNTALNGNGQAGGGLLTKIDRLITENQAKIDATMTNLQQITDKINHGNGTVGKLINDPALHDQLLAAVGDLRKAAVDARSFMGDAKDMVAQVKSGQGPLGVLLYDQQAAENLKATVANIREVSDKIAKGQGTVGKLINDDSLYTDVKGALRKADRTLDSMNDSGPITAVGIVANSLF